jgi:ABC-2 type transport system permease protein
MKKIATIIWKETLLRFANPMEWAFFLIMPVMFTFLLSGGAPSGDQDSRIRLVVVDQANNAVSQQIVQALDGSSTVRTELLSMQEAEDQLKGRRADVVLIIPPGLSTASIRDGSASVELREQPNSLDALAARAAIQPALRQVSAEISAASNALAEAEAYGSFKSESERQAYFDEALVLAQRIQTESPQRVEVMEAATPDEITYDPRANASAGQLITWVFVPLIGIAGAFAYERQRGTLKRILTTPTSKATYLVGTISAQVLIALFQMALLVTFGIIVLKLPWGRDPLALAVLLTSAALAGGAIGTALGTFIKSEEQANGLSMLVGMVMALMGGCWYPLELFPQAVQTAARVLPTTWAMQGMLDLLLRGGGLLDILPKAAVLMGFAVLFLGIGTARFRYE